MSKKLNKKGEHFNIALIVVFLSIAVSLLAFMSEDANDVTGYAVSEFGEEEISYNADVQPVLAEFNNLDDLRSLAKGNYYIDDEGVVYWLDDDSRPAIARVIYIRDIQKNRKIYIDNSGNIGYSLE